MEEGRSGVKGRWIDIRVQRQDRPEAPSYEQAGAASAAAKGTLKPEAKEESAKA